MVSILCELDTGINYQTALCAVFLEGIIFLILTVTGIRIYIAKLIPSHLKSSISVGIGLFLALIGLQSDNGIGLVVSDGATNLTIGGCGYYNLQCDEVGLECGCDDDMVMKGGTTWLGCLGFFLIAMGMVRGVRGSMIMGILFIASISWFRNTGVTFFPDTPDGDDKFDYFSNVIRFHAIEETGDALFGFLISLYCTLSLSLSLQGSH